MRINQSDYETLCRCSGALVGALRARDVHTQLHSDRVVSFVEDMGRSIGLSTMEIGALKLGACFHDIGKIGIADHILLKPGKHDPQEWEMMKQHSVIGENIVRQIELEDIEVVPLAVRHHHEYFAGGGYPDNLSGEDIPVFARIISIADNYDAMTSTRPYHRARTHRQAMDALAEDEGRTLDPFLYGVFVKTIEQSDYRSP